MSETRAPYPTKTHRAFIAIPVPPGTEPHNKKEERDVPC